MPDFGDRRTRIAEVQERLDEWITVGREEAYRDVFEGPEAEISEEDVQTLDRIDSELSRNGDGIWGTDQYGVIEMGFGDEETRPLVVCTYHPQIPETDPFARSVDDETTDRLNDALWAYCERVTAHAQESLDDFVWDGDPPPGRADVGQWRP